MLNKCNKALNHTYINPPIVSLYSYPNYNHTLCVFTPNYPNIHTSRLYSYITNSNYLLTDKLVSKDVNKIQLYIQKLVFKTRSSLKQIFINTQTLTFTSPLKDAIYLNNVAKTSFPFMSCLRLPRGILVIFQLKSICRNGNKRWLSGLDN